MSSVPMFPLQVSAVLLALAGLIYAASYAAEVRRRWLIFRSDYCRGIAAPARPWKR